MREMLRAKIVNTSRLDLFLHLWFAKPQIPPIGTPWLTTPLQGRYRRSGICTAVKSVVCTHKKFTLFM